MSAYTSIDTYQAMPMCRCYKFLVGVDDHMASLVTIQMLQNGIESVWYVIKVTSNGGNADFRAEGGLCSSSSNAQLVLSDLTTFLAS